MGRKTPRTLITAAVCVALVVAACGDDDTQPTSTTLATETSTTTTLPPEPAFVVANQGDDSPAVRALQFLLVCNGYQHTVVEGRDETLVPDGVYGAITAAIIDRVQRDIGLPRDGALVDEDLYERLAATCDNIRSVYLSKTTLSVDTGGYVSPNLPDVWTFWAQPGQRVTLTPASPPLRMGLYAPDGTEMVPVVATEGITVEIQIAGTHTVKVNSDEPMKYELTVGLPPHFSVLLLQSTGLDLVDFGDRPDRVIDIVNSVIGESSADSGWNDAGGGCVRWRRVEWGNEELWLYFTDAGKDANDKRTYNAEGVEHFAVWQMSLPPEGIPTLPPLATPSGLHVGDTAAELVEVYGDRVEIDGTHISIVDGIIVGELDAPDGTVQWLRSGAILCGDPIGEDE